MTARDRWVNEPLDGDVPKLIDTEPKPTNCRTLLTCESVQTCFSCMSEWPELSNMTVEQAERADREADMGYLGIEQPKKVLSALDAQFNSDKTDPAAIELGIKLLKRVFEIHTEIAEQLENVSPDNPKYRDWMPKQAKDFRECGKALAQSIRISEQLLKETQ